MRRLLPYALVIGTISFLIFILSCSKSAPDNNNNNLNPGGPNTGNNNNPGNTTDTASILGTWLLDILIAENITNPAPLHSDTAYPQHVCTQIFTQDSVETDSWMNVFFDAPHGVSIIEPHEYTSSSRYVKQGNKLVFYESATADTAIILQLTDHELAYRVTVPSGFNIPYGALYQHFKK